MNRPTLFVLIALNVLCAAILAGEWYSATETQSAFLPKKNNNADSEESLPELDLAATTEEDYSDLVERPMFIKGRKPVEEPEPESTPVAQVKRSDVFNWNLTGIFASPKGVTTFFSRINAKVEKDNYRKPKLGDDLDGWKITEIHPNKVTLTQAGETKTLQLLKPKPKTPVPMQQQMQMNGNNRVPPPQQQAIQQKIESAPPPETTQNPDDLSVETVNPENP